MRHIKTLVLVILILVYSEQLALADSRFLFGQVEKNQLLDVLNGRSNIVSCPLNAGYAKAINSMLTGYNQTGILQLSAAKATNTNPLKGQANKSVLKTSVKSARTIQDVLANHDLVIIVDRSGSMATQDCPGGLTRWQWCCRQASQLADAAARASSAITVMFYNNQLQVFDRVSPQSLPTLFANYRPIGGTILSAPLVAALDKYFAMRAKPVIIVVITDGIPQDTMELAPMIADASDALHYIGEVTITFLLISDQIEKQQFQDMIGEVRNGSIKNGGMVDVVGFNVLERKGIKQTLFDELNTITMTTNRDKPSPAQQFALGRDLSTVTAANPFPQYYAGTAFKPVMPPLSPSNKLSQSSAAYQASSATNPFPAYLLDKKTK